jgi:peptidyl-dipeptidase Dcp
MPNFLRFSRRSPRCTCRVLFSVTLAVLLHLNCNDLTMSTEAAVNDLPADNPFAAASELPFLTPDFAAIQDDHYQPAFMEGMKRQIAEMEAIAEQQAEPTFENTIEAMERSGELLARVSAVFFNMTSAHTNERLQQIQSELAPLLAAHDDNIHLNKDLFARVRTLYDSRKDLDLTEEQQEVLRKTYEDFVRAGALLSDEQQARIRSLNEQLSTLETRFEDALLEVTKERSVVVDDVKQLDGLSEAQIAAAAEAATARGHDGKYLLEITNTTRVPLLSSLHNRRLRRRLWEASAFRALGRDGGVDTRPLVLELAQLRAERAKLLGYETHAAYRLQPQMAKVPDAARKMLVDLVPGVVARVKEEAAELRAMMKSEGVKGKLQPWDWEYFAEKVRKAKYDIDENAVKPYFELESVLKNGVFFTMNKLYGITFKERSDLPVYHPDVRVFDVMDADGSQIGLFYADYLKRDSKRGGAWMSEFVNQASLLHQKPVIVNCLNIPRPAEGEPTLISFDNVTTLFHEMGHAVHGLFSDCTYPSIAGTNVPRDYVEFPSTFEEDWAILPEVLSNYARHYKTGEQIPQDLLDKAIRASKFNQGFETMEYMAAALLDLEWHSLTSENIPDDVEQFEADALKRVGLSHPAVPPRYRTAFFAHIWPGGYSASYYAYLWSEVLAADAFAVMRERGGLTRENGDRFRKAVLARGGSRDPMKSYVDFADHEPTVDALLIRRGLKDGSE